VPKILGIDDSQTMRRILEMTFAGEPGASIKTVDSVDAAMRSIQEQPVDVVLADASMSPDGYELAGRLRADPATQGIAVIILASQHHPYDAEKGRRCGVDDHVLKPFESQVLLDKVREVLARPRQPSQAAAPKPAGPAAPARPSPVQSPVRTPAGGPGVVPGPPAPGGVPPRAAPVRSTVAFGAPFPSRSPASPTSGQPLGPRPAAYRAEESVRPAPAAPSQALPVLAGPPPLGSAGQVAAPAAAAPATPSSPTAAAPAPSTSSPMAAGPAASVSAARSPAMLAPEASPPVGSASALTSAASMPSVAAAAVGSTKEVMVQELTAMGLTPAQIEGVLALSREVIERVVWEVVPDLAETIIREEIRRLTAE